MDTNELKIYKLEIFHVNNHCNFEIGYIDPIKMISDDTIQQFQYFNVYMHI